MLSPISSPSSQRPTTISLRQPSQSRADARTPRIALVCGSSHVFHFYQHTIQDARPYCPCIRYHPAHHHLSPSQGQQYLSSRSGPVPMSNACPHCWQRPKPPDHRFCSIACSQSAARFAPQLKYLPPTHELSIVIATQFMRCWKSAHRPKVLAVYMITWTEAYQKGFEQYRDVIEARKQFKRIGLSSGNEQKRFRSTSRACTLGERGNLTPCHNEACWMCETIRCGFEPHLERKRSVPWNGTGIRLGAGIYTSHTSSKADQYAMNVHDPSSSIRAMLVCRVVIGDAYAVCRDDPTIRSPPPGYDCVFGKPGWGSDFEEDEYVVYDADAIRAAYLVLYEKAGNA